MANYGSNEYSNMSTDEEINSPKPYKYLCAFLHDLLRFTHPNITYGITQSNKGADHDDTMAFAYYNWTAAEHI